MKKLLILAITLCSSLFTVDAADKKDLVDYVNPLVGSQSKISLSTGNTYPAIPMPCDASTRQRVASSIGRMPLLQGKWRKP